MKMIFSMIGWLTLLLPFSLFFVFTGIILLEKSFGVAAPIGLAFSAFVLAMIYGIFWRIANGMKSGTRGRQNPAMPRRLLRVRFLREREQAR